MNRNLVLLVFCLCLIGLMAGCEGNRAVFRTGVAPGERLLAYERNGEIWVITAAGAERRHPGGGDRCKLGEWSPDGKQLSVLTAVERKGEWLSGYAGVLGLNGRLRPVVGSRGLLALEPGEMAWVQRDFLVLASLDCIWLARPERSRFRAKPLYTVGDSGNERVWYPRALPGGREVSFWITSREGEGPRVRARLVTLPVAGGKPREVFTGTIWASGQAPLEALWSPDGRYALIYCEPADGGNCWWLLDRQGGMKQGVFSPEAGDFQWLPEGAKILYAPRAARQLPEYAVYEVTTGKSRPFARLPNWVTWLEVSPDGKQLLLARATGGDNPTYDLYTAATDGTGIKRLVDGVADARWQP